MKTLKKIVVFILLVAVCGVIFLFCMKKDELSDKEKVILSNATERESYLNIKGWDVTQISSDEVQIPGDFEGVYKVYAQVQQKQSLPLAEYKGRSVERFLYRVNNYNGDSEIYAELLISENNLVAAALIQQIPDGFIKPIY
ncbi:MAG: DUF4830 domain-containing protein [Oscillospiraceae bacterium]|nr:DUF4830 domain-containing protein [Oscillospiraceae bacterium]